MLRCKHEGALRFLRVSLRAFSTQFAPLCRLFYTGADNLIAHIFSIQHAPFGRLRVARATSKALDYRFQLSFAWLPNEEEKGVALNLASANAGFRIDPLGVTYCAFETQQCVSTSMAAASKHLSRYPAREELSILLAGDLIQNPHTRLDTARPSCSISA